MSSLPPQVYNTKMETILASRGFFFSFSFLASLIFLFILSSLHNRIHSMASAARKIKRFETENIRSQNQQGSSERYFSLLLPSSPSFLFLTPSFSAPHKKEGKSNTLLAPLPMVLLLLLPPLLILILPVVFPLLHSGMGCSRENKFKFFVNAVYLYVFFFLVLLFVSE